MIKPENQESFRKKIVRPFVPIHTSLVYEISEKSDIESVRKQLCVLHWLIYSCIFASNKEAFSHQLQVIPFQNCWNKNLPGGSSRDLKILQQEQRSNSKWNKFTKSTNKKKKSKQRYKRMSQISFNNMLSHNNSRRSSTRRISTTTNNYRNSMETHSEVKVEKIKYSQSRPYTVDTQMVKKRDSVENKKTTEKNRRSTTISVSRLSTITRNNSSSNGCNSSVTNSYREDNEQISVNQDQVNVKDVGKSGLIHIKETHDNLKKLLTTVEISVDSEMKKRKMISEVIAEQNRKLPISVEKWARDDYFKIKNERVNIGKIVVPTVTNINLQSTSIRPKTASSYDNTRQTEIKSSENKKNSNIYKSIQESTEKVVRPFSSPPKIQANRQLYNSKGNKRKEKLVEFKSKFNDINDASALQLHSRLKELGKKRLERNEVKMSSFEMTINFERDVKSMRTAAYNLWLEDTLRQKELNDKLKCSWVEKLNKNIPQSFVKNEDIDRVLNRIRQIGTEMSRDEKSITSEAFLNTLGKLRKWELCSPEVVGAVEFVLVEILKEDLTQDEFDEWMKIKLHKEKGSTPIGYESKNTIGNNV